MPDTFPADVKREIAHRASSVYERAAATRSGATHVEPPPVAYDQFRAWNQLFSRADLDAFVKRLGWDGLDRDSVLRAISAPSSDLDTPAWTVWIDRIAQQSATVLADFHAGRLLKSETLEAPVEYPFVELWIAPVRAARLELATRTAALEGVSWAVRQRFEHQLLREIASAAELALHAQFVQFRESEAARDAARSHPSALDPYPAFVEATLQDGFAACWQHHPVLARQLGALLEGWVTATGELFDRLREDRWAIAETFCGGRTLGSLVGVEPGLSDPHHGRRRVAGITFECGLRLVYKPRDVHIERAFNELLAWAARNGLESKPAVLRVLDRRGYGWVEHAKHSACAGRPEVRDYYRQAGGLMFLTFWTSRPGPAHGERGGDR